LTRTRAAFAATLVALFALHGTSGGFAAPCVVAVGLKVVLASDAVDPDVFLWDSRTHLVDYAAGRWTTTKAIFAHTQLAPPGTDAVVVACAAGAARLKYSAVDEDVVGVKVTKGQLKGRYGWVLASDVRPARDAHAPK
jgi:hypothetical protein